MHVHTCFPGGFLGKMSTFMSEKVHRFWRFISSKINLDYSEEEEEKEKEPSRQLHAVL